MKTRTLGMIAGAALGLVSFLSGAECNKSPQKEETNVKTPVFNKSLCEAVRDGKYRTELDGDSWTGEMGYRIFYTDSNGKEASRYVSFNE